MAGVNFTIDVKKKGIEFVQQYRKELEEILEATKNLSEENKDLNKTNEDVKEGNEKLTKSFKNLNDNITQNENKFKKYGGTVVASLALISGAIGKTAIDLAKGLNEQVVIANKMGVSFEVFQSLSKLSKQLGVDINQVSDKLLDFSKDIDEGIIRKSGPAYEALKELGIGINDLAGLDTIQRLELISTVLNSLPDVNKKNFYLDELKLKDISLIADEIGQVRDINNELRAKGLLISPAEAVAVKQFTEELNTLFSDYNTVLTKLSVTALPEIQSLISQIGLDSETAFNPENVRFLSESIIVLSGSVGIVVEVFKGFINIINFALKSVANLGIYLSDILPGLVDVAVSEISVYMKRLGSIGAEVNAQLNSLAGDVAFAVGADKLGKDLKDQADKERALSESRIASRNKEKDALKLKYKQLTEEEANARQFYLESNEMDVQKLGESYIKMQENLTKNLGKIANPQLTIKSNNEELLKKEQKLIEENERKRLEAQKKAKGLNSEIFDQEEFLKKINEEIEKTNLQYEIGSKTLEERNKILVEQYSLIKDQNELDEIEKLKAELAIKNLLAKDYFKIVQETKDLLAAGLLDEKSANEIILKNLNDIVLSEASREDKMKAQIELNNIKLQQIEKEKLLQQDLLNAKANLLKADNREVEAFDLQSQERLKIIEKEFADSKDLAERLEIEKDLINIERTKLQLEEVKDEILKLEEETKKISFLDFDQTIENQEKIIALKEKQIGLEKTLGTATKNTNEQILFTNEKVVEIMGKSLDSIAEGFANVMAGTKTLGEQARETLADILKEINKVIIRQIALNIASGLKSSTTFSGGIGGGIASLLSGVARNHVGEWSVGADHTSGQYGLKQNETLRVLEVGESVLTQSQTKDLETRMNQNTGSGTAVFDTEQSANAIFKSNSAKKFFDNLGREKGWSNI